MNYILRIIGGFWIVYSIRFLYFLFIRILHQGVHITLGLHDFVTILLFVGGIGLLLLKEWGRWTVLACCIAKALLELGPSLVHLRFSTPLLTPLVLYGLMIILLVIPASRAITQK